MKNSFNRTRLRAVSQRGLTLVEVLISSTVTAIAIAGLTTALVQSGTLSHSAGQGVTIAAASQAVHARVRQYLSDRSDELPDLSTRDELSGHPLSVDLQITVNELLKDFSEIDASIHCTQHTQKHCNICFNWRNRESGPDSQRSFCSSRIV